jgi:hypothetical protein
MGASLRLSTLALAAVMAGGFGSATVSQEPQHFHPKGNMPSRYTVEAQRHELEDVMIGAAKLADKVAGDKATLVGNPQVLAQLGSTMVKFDNWFEVLPGTKKEAILPPKPELFEDDVAYEAGPP